MLGLSAEQKLLLRDMTTVERLHLMRSVTAAILQERLCSLTRRPISAVALSTAITEIHPQAFDTVPKPMSITTPCTDVDFAN